MPTARVLAVAPGSPAFDAGVRPGDELLALNGEAVRDVIRYQIQADEPVVELEVRRGGMERVVTVEKAPGASLGLDLASAVFDRVQTCDNHCPFCFIYQLPEGMRRSLYLKDDDYRLSFLYGNFTTLTRFTEADLERVIDERLSPLYVSIHATDPELRTKLLRNKRGATSLRWLRALLDAGVEVHGQVVVCPGVNDGLALEETMLGVLDRFPELTTVGVVPLGVSDHSDEVEMRPHTTAEAAAVVDTVEAWQERFAAALGRRLVYASDEYYLLAGRPFPDLDRYDGVPQHENGVGMVRQFESEVRGALRGDDVDAHGTRSGFFSWVDGAPAEGYRAPRTAVQPSGCGSGAPADPSVGAFDAAPPAGVPVALTTTADRARPVTILTGVYGERVLAPLLDELRTATDVPVDVLAIENRFFGGNIAVTGLLTGRDVADALADVQRAEGAHPQRRFLLPDVVLSNGRFLDDTSPDDLPVAVEVVATDGASLVAALARR